MADLILEGLAIRLGAAVASEAGKAWMRQRKSDFERSASLAQLIQAEIKSPLQRRKAANLIERIGQQVAEQLSPTLEKRFPGIPENEAEAAILATIGALEAADLSDRAFFASDADPEVLAKKIRSQFPAGVDLLSSQAERLYELSLDLACRHLIQIARYLPSFQSASMVEVLSRLTAQSEQLELLLCRIPRTNLYAPSGSDQDDEFKAEYLTSLSSSLDKLELLGLPGTEQPNLTLTVAYLSLSAIDKSGHRPQVMRRVSQRNQGRWLYVDDDQDAEGVPVEAAIGDGSRVLLRGDAGSGKTTLLNWLAVKVAQGEMVEPMSDWNECVPFVIRLRRFAEGELPSPETWVSHALPSIADVMPKGWVHRILKRGCALVLVDGVDEVPASRRRAVKAWLSGILLPYPNIRIVVSARQAAADSKWLAEEGFHAVTLEPMSTGSIVEFVKRWHHAAELSGVQVNDAESRLRTQLERSQIRQLAASPLLCAMLCALNLSRRSELPQNRMELYAKALSMLLHLRDSERGISALLGDVEKSVILRDLAWRLTLAKRVELPRHEAQSYISHKVPGMPNVSIDAETILDHLLERSGVLREPIPGRVDFIHRTFLEYLAADEAIQQHHVSTLTAHAHQDTWLETVVMACGHATTTQTNALLTDILDRADSEPANARKLRLLAAACLETVQDVDPNVRSRVDDVIKQKLVPPRSRGEATSLASIGDRVLNYLPETLEGLSAARAVAVVRTAALTGSTAALPLLKNYASDIRPSVQNEIQSSWHLFEPAKYASIVLSEAALYRGFVTVRSLKHLPYVELIQNLQSLHVLLGWAERLHALDPIIGIPKLTKLSFSINPSVKYDLGLLNANPQLKHVMLHGVSGETSIAPLNELPSIEVVGLDEPHDEVLIHAPVMDRVRCLLFFTSLKSTSEVKVALDRFPLVESLNLAGFGTLNIKLLTILKDLKHLTLQYVKFRDLKPLSNLKNLQTLNIWNKVDFDRNLEPLHGLPLSLLVLERGFSYDGIDGLRCRPKRA